MNKLCIWVSLLALLLQSVRSICTQSLPNNQDDCTQDSECCGGKCWMGGCCTDAGGKCSDNNECCGEPNYRRCVDSECCKGNGAKCTAETECCSDKCEAYNGTPQSGTCCDSIELNKDGNPKNCVGIAGNKCRFIGNTCGNRVKCCHNGVCANGFCVES
eukprot:546038_1